ncbi:MAG: hypothetical protein MZV70_08120 [Desulfobacterales bacterium]|nr:hypothetical protein [Desulfobacterales bacterium]
MVFAAFDAEESGLRGARAFVGRAPGPAGFGGREPEPGHGGAAPPACSGRGGAVHTPALRPILEDGGVPLAGGAAPGARPPRRSRGRTTGPGQSDHRAFHERRDPLRLPGRGGPPGLSPPHRRLRAGGSVRSTWTRFAPRSSPSWPWTRPSLQPDAEPAPATDRGHLMKAPRLRLPHPLVLLSGCVFLAAAASRVVPAGEFDRRPDEATGRTVVVAGTYHEVDPAPVVPLRGAGGASTGAHRRRRGGLPRVPRGRARSPWWTRRVRSAGAWDGWLVSCTAGISWSSRWCRSASPRAGWWRTCRRRSSRWSPCSSSSRGPWASRPSPRWPCPPARRFVGSAFSPINPFQVTIAQKLAELPLGSGGLFRMAFLALALALLGGHDHAARCADAHRRRGRPGDRTPSSPSPEATPPSSRVVALTFGVVVQGMLGWGWGFNEALRVLLPHGNRRGRPGRAARGRHRGGVREGVPGDGVRGRPHRLRAGDLRGAGGRAHRGHAGPRHVHAPGGTPRARVGAGDDGGPGRHPRPGTQRERPGRADHAGARAALRPPGAVTPGHRARLPVWRRALRPRHPDERRPHGHPGNRRGALRGVDALRRAPLSGAHGAGRGRHRRGDRHRAGMSVGASFHPRSA